MLWPAATRAERVEVSDEGIEAWTLTGTTRLAWDDVTGVQLARSPLGRRMLRIRGSAGRIDVARLLPGYDGAREPRLRGPPGRSPRA